MEYKGFEINESNFGITRNGKPVFTAHWQQAETLEQAKMQIDSSLITKAVFNKFPNLSKIDLVGICELENGTEKAERFENWMNNEAEKLTNV